MRITAKAILVIAGLVPAVAARADGYLQNEYAHRTSLFGVSWEYAVPLGNLRTNFGDAASTSGYQLTMRFGLAPQLSTGIDASYNRFQYTFPIGGDSRMDDVSLRGTIHYYLTGSDIQPYVGIGAGGLWREAIFGPGPTQSGFGLCVDPQVGLLLTLDTGLALNVLARYEFTTASFNVNGNPQWPVKLPSWAGLQVGLAFY